MAALWFSAALLGVGFFMVCAIVIAKTASGNISAIEKGSILMVDLGLDVVDRPVSRSLVDRLQNPSTEEIALNEIVAALDGAADDSRIEGVYLNCGGGSAGLAQAQAIIDALGRFRKSGKWVYAYGDTYTQDNYLVATAADSIFMNPIGSVDIHGLAATTMYFHKMLENLGVKAQVVKVGTYKSAVEPFLLDDMSEASRLQQQVFLDNMWGVVRERIAKARKLTPERVNELADTFMMTLTEPFFTASHLVDKVVYEHEMLERLENLTGNDEPQFVSPARYCAEKGLINNIKGADKRIAVLYAVGDIVDSGDGGIVSSTLVPQIMELVDDDDIDGLILRVNSGGGSAYASEQIWEALGQFKKITGKPFYVSMGDVAASGGYYISCGADKIYAEPLTLTGSIGIFGIIPEASELLNNKLGVNTSTVATNPGSLPPTIFKPMTERQRASMQRYVDTGYELFVKRCADGRKMAVDSIKKIAEGRVWDGQMALRIGLVDKLGGLDAAIADMTKQLGVASCDIVEYPKVKTKWWEEIFELDDEMVNVALDRELGPARKLYANLRSVMNMAPLQCRMEYMEVR